jgi:hypothetical protein
VTVGSLINSEVEDALASAWMQGVGTFAEQVESADTLPTEGFEEVNYVGYEDDIMLEPSREWMDRNRAHPSLSAT